MYFEQDQITTLLINGTEDGAQDVAMRPFFGPIEKAKGITLAILLISLVLTSGRNI